MEVGSSFVIKLSRDEFGDGRVSSFASGDSSSALRDAALEDEMVCLWLNHWAKIVCKYFSEDLYLTIEPLVDVDRDFVIKSSLKEFGDGGEFIFGWKSQTDTESSRVAAKGS